MTKATDGRKPKPQATLEQRALAVVEYRLTGCQERAAEATGVPRATLQTWIKSAEAGTATKRGKAHDLAKRVEILLGQRRASLDALYDRAVELQMRDLPAAGFRDRTGLIKIVGEQRLLAAGKPTSIIEERDKLDHEIEKLLAELAGNDGHTSAAA